MSADPRTTLAALHRFGLGARPGDLARIGSGARDLLRDEVRQGRSPRSGASLIPASARPRRRCATSWTWSAASARRAPRPRPRWRRDQARRRHPLRKRRRRSLPSPARRAAAAGPRLPRGGARPPHGDAGAARRLRRAARDVLGQPFRGLGQQGPAGEDLRRADGARGDPAACLRPLRQHAARRRAAPGDDRLSRQPAIHRPQLARRGPPRPGPEREPRPRNPGAAHARRRRRLRARRRDRARPHHHRLDAERAERQ